MNVCTFQTYSREETEKLGCRLAKLLKPSDVIALEGDLGAGKTTFAKGLAKGLGIQRVVNSPTFTIIKEYEGDLPLYHMDVYRLEGQDEDLGFDEYFFGDGVTVVEWAQFIQDLLPEEHLKITIKHVKGDEREFRFIPNGERFIQICEELINGC